MKSFRTFIALLSLILLEKTLADEAGNVTTPGKSTDDIQNVRDEFKKKFMGNSLRSTAKRSEPDISTIIKTSKIIDGDEVIIVTEKETRMVYEEVEEYHSSQNGHAGVSQSEEETRKTSIGNSSALNHGEEDSRSSSSQLNREECDCMKRCAELGDNSGKVTELKFFKTVPEVFVNDTTNIDTKNSNREVNYSSNVFNSSNKSENSYTSSGNNKDTKRSPDDFAESCAEIMLSNPRAGDGVYNIQLLGNERTKVYCQRDKTESGCAWTLFMRRQKIGDLFDKSWEEYQSGFGDLNASFFLGLDYIHALTRDIAQELGIFTYFETNHVEAETYAAFRVGDESTGYKVEALGKFLDKSAIRRLLLNSKFSTRDKDNGSGYDRCAKLLDMGWWYSQNCKAAAKLSGVHAYLNAPVIMGLRPANCKL